MNPKKGTMQWSLRVRTRVLGGSWVVISGAIIRLTIVITHIKGLITLHITTHEPPSNQNPIQRVPFILTTPAGVFGLRVRRRPRLK